MGTLEEMSWRQHRVPLRASCFGAEGPPRWSLPGKQLEPRSPHCRAILLPEERHPSHSLDGEALGQPGLTMTLGGRKPSESQATASRSFSVSQSRSSKASPRVQCELCRSLPAGMMGYQDCGQSEALPTPAIAPEVGGGQSWQATSWTALQSQQEAPGERESSQDHPVRLTAATGQKLPIWGGQWAWYKATGCWAASTRYRGPRGWHHRPCPLTCPRGRRCRAPPSHRWVN